MWLECAFLKWLAAVSLGVDFQSLFEASKAPLPSRGINQFAGRPRNGRPGITK